MSKFAHPEVNVGDVVLWFPQADNRNSVGRPATVLEVGSGGSVNLFLPHRYLRPVKGCRHVDDPFHTTKRQATLTNGGWEHTPTTKRLLKMLAAFEQVQELSARNAVVVGKVGNLQEVGVAAKPPLPAAVAPPAPPASAATAAPVGTQPAWAEASNEPPAVEDEYENMSLPDLRAAAVKFGIPHTPASNRANLRALIREHLSTKVEAVA